MPWWGWLLTGVGVGLIPGVVVFVWVVRLLSGMFDAFG